jgi:hypothetical protein
MFYLKQRFTGNNNKQDNFKRKMPPWQSLSLDLGKLKAHSKVYCNVHNYGFGLGRNYTVVLRAIHPHNHENPQTARWALKSPYFIVIVPFSTVKVSTLNLIFLTFS